MSCGVVPARHIVLSSPIRGLRPRLLSLRSVLPSRQIVLNEIFCPRIARIFVQASAKPNLFELCRAQPKMSKKLTRIVAMDKWRPGRSHELSLMQGGLYLHVLWRSATSSRFSAALGIARTSSALRSLARKFQALVLTFYCPMIREIRGQNIFPKFVQASAIELAHIAERDRHY